MKGKLSSLVIISLFLLIIPAAHCSDKSAEVLKLSSVKLTTDEDITKAILWAQIKNTGTMSLDSSCKVHFYVRNSDKTIDQVVGDVFCTATDHQGNSGPLGKGEIRWYKYEWPVPEKADTYKYWASVMEDDRRISAWSIEKAFNIKDKRILFIRGEESDNVKEGSVSDSGIFGYSSLYKSLIEEGFEVEEITNPIITSKLLELYDIAVFSGRWENRVLDDSEARAFVDYVNNGGNLLLMSQYYHPSRVTNDLDSVNKIGSIIGVSFSYGVVCDPNSYLSEVNKPVIADIIDHDVTRGIRKFNLNWGTSLIVSTPSKAIAHTTSSAWLDTNSIFNDKGDDLYSVKDDNEPRQKLPVLAVGEYGYGKFVAIGDAGSIDDGDIDNYNNKNLAKNIFNWLSLPTTKNHPPKAIRLEPNGDTGVKVGETVKFKIKVEDLDDEKEDQHMVMWFIDNKWEITSLTDKETKEASFIYKFETPGIFNIKATAYDECMEEDSVAWLINAGITNIKNEYILNNPPKLSYPKVSPGELLSDRLEDLSYSVIYEDEDGDQAVLIWVNLGWTSSKNSAFNMELAEVYDTNEIFRARYEATVTPDDYKDVLSIGPNVFFIYCSDGEDTDLTDLVSQPIIISESKLDGYSVIDDEICTRSDDVIYCDWIGGSGCAVCVVDSNGNPIGGMKIYIDGEYMGTTIDPVYANGFSSERDDKGWLYINEPIPQGFHWVVALEPFTSPDDVGIVRPGDEEGFSRLVSSMLNFILEGRGRPYFTGEPQYITVTVSRHFTVSPISPWPLTGLP